MKYISNFNNSGIDIFNIQDIFFNDICNPYSNSENDIILQDRIKYIYQNYSLCNQECSYNNIDIENRAISCNCSVKQNLSTIIEPLNIEKEKKSTIMDSNIGVIKCYKLVFSLENKLKNIGFMIFLVLIIINTIFLILYFYKGIKSVLEYIFNEMVKYGYLKRNDKMFFVDKNDLEKNKEKIKIRNKKKRNKTISNPIKNKSNNKENNAYGNKKKKYKKSKRNINLNLSNDNKNSYSTEKLKSNKKHGLNYLLENLKNSNMKKNKKAGNKKHIKISSLTTDNKIEEKEKENTNNFGIIRIDLNDIKNYTPQDSFHTLHNYSFKEAIKYDKRSIFKIFYIYLLSKQIIFHTFFQKNPLELFYLRICLFIFMLSSDLALNSLLYLNDNISKKYQDAKGLFLFTFSNNLTIILLSTLLSFILVSLVSKLSNSTNAIRKVFRNEEEKIKANNKYKNNEKRKKEIYFQIEKILKIFKIKILILIIIEIILILFFWYFVTAFCHVFSNTQTSWLLDSFLSFLSRVVIELLFALLFSKLYIISVESNCYSLYRALLFIYDLS